MISAFPSSSDGAVAAPSSFCGAPHGRSDPPFWRWHDGSYPSAPRACFVLALSFSPQHAFASMSTLSAQQLKLPLFSFRFRGAALPTNLFLYYFIASRLLSNLPMRRGGRSCSSPSGRADPIGRTNPSSLLFIFPGSTGG